MIVVKDQATMMMMNQQQQNYQLMNMEKVSLNRMNLHRQQQPIPQPQMIQMNRNHRMWPSQQQFRSPNSNPNFNQSLAPRNNWKGKKVNSMPNNKRRMDHKKSPIHGVNVISAGSGGWNMNFNNSSNFPKLNELHHQNRFKTRKFFPKKKFNKNNSMNMNMSNNANDNMSAPFAPRNTTSFIIRSKKSGGIAPLVPPCPVTPSVLPTPMLSPSRELLGDTAKEEWGVDGYGSMKGLIRLRSFGHEMDGNDDEEVEDEGGSSGGSDLDGHVEVEKRLDHDLSRFEMIYDPKSVNGGGMVYNNVLENRVDDQDTHIGQLEEENLTLKERLFFMETELADLRRRMMCLERMGNGGEDINGEVVENESENESGSRGEESRSVEGNNGDFIEEGIDREKIAESHGEGNVEHNDGLNVGDKIYNNAIDLESKEESNKDGYEKNIVDMDENKTEFYEHENVGGDVCVLENGVAKDCMDLENNGAN